ncbi:MAG: DPP IV N-terminal domain-containing protein, partial [Leeuwenhoekiella sp.]
MKYFLYYTFICFFGYHVTGQETTSTTKEDYDRAVKFLAFNTYPLVYNGNVNAHWIDNDDFWYQNTSQDGTSFIWVNAKTGKKTVADSKENLFNRQKFTPENQPELKRTEILSPDGLKVVYIQDWNLWMRNIQSGKEIQLTKDGIENFGYATDNAGWKHSDRPIVLW